MSFRDNLVHLRATRNMTQEQLAMLLGVSRQSVSKWEAERAYPEMDKLLKLCSLFDCTLDELVTGDVTERTPNEVEHLSPAQAPQDVTGYDDAMRAFAWKCPLGLAIMLASAALALLLAGMFSAVGFDGVYFALVLLLLGMAAGLAILLLSIGARRAFRRAHPFIEDFYTAEQKNQASATFVQGLVACCCFLLAGAGAAFVLQADIWFASAAFCGCAAIGVFLLVRGWLLKTRCDVAAYNDRSLVGMDERDMNALDEALHMRARRVRHEHNVFVAIMGAATAVGLVLLFVPLRAVQACFWLAWPVGGLAYVIVRALWRMHSDA